MIIHLLYFSLFSALWDGHIKKEKNMLNKMVIALSLFLASNAYGAAFITKCDNCTSIQYQKKAEQVRAYNDVIVIDLKKGNINTYRVRSIFIDDGIEERIATQVTTNSTIKNNYYGYIENRDAFNAHLVSMQQTSGEVEINDVIGANTNVNAIDWLHDDIHSKQFYDNMAVQEPSLVNRDTFWRAFKDMVSIQYSVGAISASISLQDYNEKLVIEFNDKSKLVLSFDPVTKSV